MKFGLIGKQLSHSWSKSYFETKWIEAETKDHEYLLLEFSSEEEIQKFFDHDIYNFKGLNVTLPYKSFVLDFVDKLSNTALEIKAINCLKINNRLITGHNTDGPAFLESLQNFIKDQPIESALIVGDGGSSKAVQWALKKLNIKFNIVSRKNKELDFLSLNKKWNNDWRLIVQTTPVGMFPHSDQVIDFPFDRIGSKHLVYDLIYNPDETLFLKNCRTHGASCLNGLEMLKRQAELSWQFWQGI